MPRDPHVADLGRFIATVFLRGFLEDEIGSSEEVSVLLIFLVTVVDCWCRRRNIFPNKFLAGCRNIFPNKLLAGFCLLADFGSLLFGPGFLEYYKSRLPLALNHRVCYNEHIPCFIQ